MKTTRAAVAVAFVLLFWFLQGCCAGSRRSAPQASEARVNSPYYRSNVLARALKAGMARQDVIDSLGQPSDEVAGLQEGYSCLIYTRRADPGIPQKPGEFVGFQVWLKTNSVFRWNLVLSATDHIRMWYDKYKTDDELLDSYLEGLGAGFKMGVDGQAASFYLPGPDLTPSAARGNGLVCGYDYGKELFASLSGNPAGYRERPRRGIPSRRATPAPIRREGDGP